MSAAVCAVCGTAGSIRADVCQWCGAHAHRPGRSCRACGVYTLSRAEERAEARMEGEAELAAAAQ